MSIEELKRVTEAHDGTVVSQPRLIQALKTELEETLGKHRHEMTTQETTISDLKKKLEEADKIPDQRDKEDERIKSLDDELQKKSDALAQSRKREASLTEETENLQERLKSMEVQVQQV